MITKKMWIKAIIFNAEYGIAFENNKSNIEIEKARRRCIRVREAKKTRVSPNGRLIFISQ